MVTREPQTLEVAYSLDEMTRLQLHANEAHDADI